MNHFKHEYKKGDELQLLRSLKHINRLSGKPIIQKYSVAEHCYYTGILFEHFAQEEKINVTRTQIRFVYRHDIMESITGDLLRPAKNYNIIVKDLWDKIEKELSYAFEIEEYIDETIEYTFPENVVKLFKTCDILELLLFLNEEKELGNNTEAIDKIFHNCIQYIYEKEFRSIIDFMEIQIRF